MGFVLFRPRKVDFESELDMYTQLNLAYCYMQVGSEEIENETFFYVIPLQQPQSRCLYQDV